MNIETCLEKLKYVSVLSFATVDKKGAPQIRNISAIHYEKDRLYFFTARGKAFCEELLATGQVQILGYTKYKEMIRISANVLPAPKMKQDEYINTIFKEQPYLANVYPNSTREIGIIFEIKDGTVEYFNLGVSPIFRENYQLGNGKIKPKGYSITDKCISCGKCLKSCPQSCIKIGKPYQIIENNCLHCGACYEICPMRAVKKR